MKRFNGVCLVTQNVPIMREFYRKVLQVDVEGDDVFASLATPGAEFLLFSEDGMEEMAPGAMSGAGRGSYTLDFEVENVDREYQRLLQLKVSIVKPPESYPWGRRSVWFRDPDNNIVNFYMKVEGE